jgi:hypothetical protein
MLCMLQGPIAYGRNQSIKSVDYVPAPKAAKVRGNGYWGLQLLSSVPVLHSPASLIAMAASPQELNLTLPAHVTAHSAIMRMHFQTPILTAATGLAPKGTHVTAFAMTCPPLQYAHSPAALRLTSTCCPFLPFTTVQAPKVPLMTRAKGTWTNIVGHAKASFKLTKTATSTGVLAPSKPDVICVKDATPALKKYDIFDYMSSFFSCFRAPAVYDDEPESPAASSPPADDDTVSDLMTANNNS